MIKVKIKETGEVKDLIILDQFNQDITSFIIRPSDLWNPIIRKKEISQERFNYYNNRIITI